MKKVLPALLLVSLLAVPVISLAGYEGETPDQEQQELISSGQELIDLIDNIANWVFVALLALAGIFLIIAGFMWVTAGGNVESTTKARQMLINALIGVAIGLGAKGLIAVVKSLLGYTG
ncbi:hypothetical protein ES703_104446 [subsurface metagenome]